MYTLCLLMPICTKVHLYSSLVCIQSNVTSWFSLLLALRCKEKDNGRRLRKRERERESGERHGVKIIVYKWDQKSTNETRSRRQCEWKCKKEKGKREQHYTANIKKKEKGVKEDIYTMDCSPLSRVVWVLNTRPSRSTNRSLLLSSQSLYSL